MDSFVKSQLLLCGCSHFEDLFSENEIDEEVFRDLTMDDLRAILPNKVGVQKKIMSVVEQLRKEKKGSTEGVNGGALAAGGKGDLGMSNFGQRTSDTTRLTSAEPAYFQNVSKTENNITLVANGNSHHQLDSDIMSKVTSMLKKYSFSDVPSSFLSAAPVPSTSNPADLGVRHSSVKLDDGKKVNMNEKRRIVSRKILQRQEKLPIYNEKMKFIEMIKAHQVLIVEGETGSGKSTQLTQYLHQAGFSTYGKIGCTQPRRIAAKALAKRVAEEFGTTLGEQVGFRIRFENLSSCNTLITYMTDGILLQEMATEPDVFVYSAIMLDEAHERSLNTDILFGLLKSSIKKRSNLKVIITSATLDADKFSRYFNDAPIFKIHGRTFPVEVVYMGNPEPDYMNACVSTVMRIHRFENEGDVLVFLPGQEEIERCCDLLIEQDDKQQLWVVPCYSALSLEEQSKVFDPAPDGCRKVVVATNIAETSLTIDGIVYVVDSGVVKQSEYDPKKSIKTLAVKPITQAQAIQRKGRAGRTRPGKVFRLYSEDRYNKMPKCPVPEIQRSNLESTILLLAAHGVEDIFGFDFIDPPARENITASMTDLQDLQALDSRGRLTSLGRQISRFPLEPKLSKILIMSAKLHCTKEILTIVSMLSVQSTTGKIFLRPKKHKFLADQAKSSFFKEQGDHLTLLKVYDTWKSNFKSKEWCRKNFINFKAMEEVVDIRDQLKSIMQSHSLNPTETSYLVDPEAVQKTLVSGYFNQVARKMPKGHGYVTYSNPNEREPVFIHPSSSLFKTAPNWIIYEEMINTGKKTYLTNVVAIEPRWIQTYAPEFFQKLKLNFPQLMYQLAF